MTSLAGQKAIVCGATGGMGEAVSHAFAHEGIQVALMGRNEAQLNRLAKECSAVGRQALPIPCDLSKSDLIGTSVATAIRALGGLNILVNCAGIHKRGRTFEVDLADWDKVVDTNLRGHYTLVRHALPEINKSPGGAVIKIGSIAVPHASGAMHLTVSRGLDGYADCLFEDVREFGTKVCTIRPGYVNTALSQSERLDPDRMIQPNDIAETVVFVLRMPQTACPTEIVLRPQRSPYRR